MGIFLLNFHRCALLAILGAIGALRSGELVFSAWRLKQDQRRGQAAPIVEPLFPWMFGVHSAWYAGCACEGWFAPWAFPAGVLWGCAALWTTSLALRIWLWATLGRWWSVRLVARERQPVIVAGPYAYVRHPNYLAVILEIATVPLLLGAVWTAVFGTLSNAIVVALRIRREERYLFSRPGYAAAFAGKKRFVPRVY